MPTFVKQNNTWTEVTEVWINHEGIWKPLLNEASLYKWNSTPWTDCTQICGGGVQERVITCVLAEDNTVLSDSVCISALGAKPEEIRDCNTHNCI